MPKIGDVVLCAGVVYLTGKHVGKNAAKAMALLIVLYLLRLVKQRVARRMLRRLGRKSGLKAVIIGTGFSGLCAAVKMQEMGVDFEIIETHENQVGGTWRDNVYPGCECDVRSALYSFSFSQNPYWTRLWAPQTEILNYMKSVTTQYNLRPHISFGTTVTSLTWDPVKKTWCVGLKDNATGVVREVVANIVIAGCGQLREPAYPKIPTSDFKGKTMHTAAWDPTYSFEGKSIGIIGSGASAIQVVPYLAKQSSSMAIYQRSPPWVAPKPNATNPWVKKFMLSTSDIALNVTRGLEFVWGEVFYDGIISTKNPSQREFMQGVGIKDMKVEMRPENKHLYSKILPSYDAGCKRILLTNDWYKAVQMDNVELVTEGVDRLSEHGIVAKDGKVRECDVIVYATGFQTQRFVFPIEVRGANGVELSEYWTTSQGTMEPRAYLGMSVPEFPNFFMLYGPTTNLGSNSIIYMIESQMEQICLVTEQLIRKNQKVATVTESAYDSWLARAKVEINDTVFSKTSDCHSWYTNDAGVPINNWWGPARQFGKLCSKIHENSWRFE